MLPEIKQYLKQRGQVSLEDIAIHFDREPGAIREMLAMLLRKGEIDRYNAGAAHGCNACGGCPPDRYDIYVWKQKAER